jgi:hypothetical protein
VPALFDKALEATRLALGSSSPAASAGGHAMMLEIEKPPARAQTTAPVRDGHTETTTAPGPAPARTPPVTRHPSRSRGAFFSSR